MRSNGFTRLFSLVALLAAVPSASGQAPLPAEEPPEVGIAVQMKSLPISGGVRIDQLSHDRSISNYNGKAFHQERMQLRLSLVSRLKDRQGPFLIRLTEIDPIEDDTGKVLSTRHAKRDWNFLHENVPTDDRFREPTPDPQLIFDLAPPARHATKIKSLKGKAIVSKQKLSALGFSGATTFHDKPLEHPLLQDFPIRATFRVQDPVKPLVSMKLKVPRYASRIREWGLAKDGKLLRSISSGSNNLDGDKTIHYQEIDPTDSVLAIIVADPIEPEEFTFDFKDLELP